MKLTINTKIVRYTLYYVALIHSARSYFIVLVLIVSFIFFCSKILIAHPVRLSVRPTVCLEMEQLLEDMEISMAFLN